MEQRHLGRTGLRVSRLGLGTMTWSRDTDAARRLRAAPDFADAGGTLIDTSASYADGGAEALLGALLDDVVPRDEMVLCTKAGIRRTSTGGVVDASRGGLLDSLDASLKRLRTDHVDLWLVQTPDPHTPLDETVSALRLAVTSGRARYVGLSNHAGWQVARAATLLEREIGLTAVEAEYSLLQRGIEREVLPASTVLGVGVLAWSPLGRGVLTGKYRRDHPRGLARRVAAPRRVRRAVPGAVLRHDRRGRRHRRRGPGAHAARRRARLGAQPRHLVGDRRRPHRDTAAGVAGRGGPRASRRAAPGAQRDQRTGARLPREVS